VAPAIEDGDIEARLVGKSPRLIKRLISQLKKLATVRSPVLITGETGTRQRGEVAEILHAASGGARCGPRAHRLPADHLGRPARRTPRVKTARAAPG
jgi:transcriptional regulator with AAA-type ATPase domain